MHGINVVRLDCRNLLEIGHQR